MENLEPPQRLQEHILLSIRQEERRRAWGYLLASFTTACGSILGLVFSIQYALQSLYQSNFYSYLFLLFSDTDVMFSYWRELLFSLIETVPLLEITAALIAVVVLLVSVRVFAHNARGHLTFSFGH